MEIHTVIVCGGLGSARVAVSPKLSYRRDTSVYRGKPRLKQTEWNVHFQMLNWWNSCSTFSCLFFKPKRRSPSCLLGSQLSTVLRFPSASLQDGPAFSVALPEARPGATSSSASTHQRSCLLTHKMRSLQTPKCHVCWEGQKEVKTHEAKEWPGAGTQNTPPTWDGCPEVLRVDAAGSWPATPRLVLTRAGQKSGLQLCLSPFPLPLLAGMRVWGAAAAKDKAQSGRSAQWRRGDAARRQCHGETRTNARVLSSAVSVD